MQREPLENPLLAYVAIAAALMVGMLSATVFAKPAPPTAVPGPPAMATGPPVIATGPPTMATGPSAAFSARASAVPAESAPTVEPAEPGEAAAEAAGASARRWILGVRSRPTSIGCVITDVIPNSAADRVGLSVGDRLITVDGRQVGWIGRRQVALHRLIDRAAAPRVRVLMQRGAGGELVSLTIRLQTVSESLGHPAAQTLAPLGL
jgi:S1-C subfamily serine protease